MIYLKFYDTRGARWVFWNYLIRFLLSLLNAQFNNLINKLLIELHCK